MIRDKVLIMLILLLCSVSAWAQSSGQSNRTYTIVDTGQSDCYDEYGNKITCPLSGSSLFGQDVQYTTVAPSYKDNGNGTVTDNNTGLMWQQDPGDKVSFAEAVAGADSFNLAGYTDWRLPTVKELYSLINFDGQTGNGRLSNVDDTWVPFIDTKYFVQEYGDTSTGVRLIDGQTWSATEYVSTTMNKDETVFGLNYVDGRIKGYPKYDPRSGSENKLFCRYVRGNKEYGINKFQDDGNGTVTDRATGLMWQQADDGKGHNWGEALSYCEGLSLGGHSDWRLPDAKELQSLLDYSRSPDTTDSAAIDPVFSVTKVAWTSPCDGKEMTNYPTFWASTTHREYPEPYGDKAVYVCFGEALGNMHNNWMDVHGAGSQRSDPKAGDPDSSKWACGFGPQGDYIGIYNYVRCVRDVD